MMAKIAETLKDKSPIDMMLKLVKTSKRGRIRSKRKKPS